MYTCTHVHVHIHLPRRTLISQLCEYIGCFDNNFLLAISDDGLLCQAREQRQWQGCRSTLGVKEGNLSLFLHIILRV